jgi:hypothetical protein
MGPRSADEGPTGLAAEHHQLRRSHEIAGIFDVTERG